MREDGVLQGFRHYQGLLEVHVTVLFRLSRLIVPALVGGSAPEGEFEETASLLLTHII
jgi:hypothetical protein